LRKLPARFAHHLIQAAGHALQQRSEAQLLADLPRLPVVRWGKRVLAAHQQIEPERSRKDMVLVILRSADDTPAPAFFSQRRPIEPAGQDQPRRRLPESGQQRRECRLAAARPAFEQQEIATPYFQIAAFEDRLYTSVM